MKDYTIVSYASRNNFNVVDACFFAFFIAYMGGWYRGPPSVKYLLDPIDIYLD